MGVSVFTTRKRRALKKKERKEEKEEEMIAFLYSPQRKPASGHEDASIH